MPRWHHILFSASLANHKYKFQGVRYPPPKSLLKRDSGIQDVPDERLLKKQRLSSCDEDDMRRVQHEIAGIKESVEKLTAEVRKDRQEIRALRELLHKMRRKSWNRYISNCKYLILPLLMFRILFTPFATENQPAPSLWYTYIYILISFRGLIGNLVTQKVFGRREWLWSQKNQIIDTAS